MKKLILLGFIMCCIWSCSTGDDNAPDFYYETLPIESVTMDEEFQLGNTHQITMTYLRPSGCHVFNDFYFVSEGNQRTIAVINTVFPNQECETFEYEIEEVSFNFQVNSFEDYVFRFWQGEDINGNDIYYVVEVPVID